MKPLHLSIFACLAAIWLPLKADAGLFDSPQLNVASMFRPLTNVNVVFRAQSDEVPLPPGVRVTPNPQPRLPPFDSPDGTVVQPGGLMVPPENSLSMPYNGSQISPAGGFLTPGTPIPAVPMYQSAPQTVDGTFGQTIPTSPDPSTWNAFSPPISPDPFAGGNGLQQPYAPYMPYGDYSGPSIGGAFSTYGTNGPSPFRLGWHHDLSAEWMAPSKVTGNAAGLYEEYGIDYDMGYTGAFMPGWMFTWTNQFQMRNWDGPIGIPGLPGEAYRLGVDMEVANATAGPMSIKLGITPSINTDFDGSPGSGAYQLDGRGLLIFQLSQYWNLVLGAGFWDRVKDRVIPYAGVVYRDDYWEMRLMYPESTVSVFLGNELMGAKWWYFRAEYHVEAYEVNTGGGGRDEVEFEDYRLMTGFRMDSGLSEWFAEGGWVFDRNVDFAAPANGGFSPGTSFLLRSGLKF
ncbi:MAG: hypothetical protein R3C59_25200 [Planctomycetaceae bacterium]